MADKRDDLECALCDHVNLALDREDSDCLGHTMPCSRLVSVSPAG